MSDWLPDNINDAQVRGLGTGDGFLTARNPKTTPNNKLQQSSDPLIANIGEWLAGCPPNFPAHMAAHTGLMIGVSLALKSDNVQHLLDSILGREFLSDDEFDSMSELLANIVTEIADGNP